MDGVIIDSQSIADQLLKATCATLGVFLTDAELFQLTGASSRKFWTYVKSAYALPKSVEYYRSLHDVDSEIKAYESLSADDGLILFLRFLKAQAMKTALATSASRKRMQAVLQLFGLSRAFDAAVCDQDVLRSKPAPDIFLAAAKALSLPPRDCAVARYNIGSPNSLTKSPNDIFVHRPQHISTRFGLVLHDSRSD